MYMCPAGPDVPITGVASLSSAVTRSRRWRASCSVRQKHRPTKRLVVSCPPRRGGSTWSGPGIQTFSPASPLGAKPCRCLCPRRSPVRNPASLRPRACGSPPRPPPGRRHPCGSSAGGRRAWASPPPCAEGPGRPRAPRRPPGWPSGARPPSPGPGARRAPSSPGGSRAASSVRTARPRLPRRRRRAGPAPRRNWCPPRGPVAPTRPPCPGPPCGGAPGAPAPCAPPPPLPPPPPRRRRSVARPCAQTWA
mmetsp:Transcript_23984/g.80586  ORF Transcript_23984/g.80586 Transcript_23984/m.80586 type:complete len:250 (+) Transcript_23984:188-937(+)